MKPDWKSPLHFTQSERRGMIVLGLLCLILLQSPLWFPTMHSQEIISHLQTPLHQQAIDSLPVQIPIANERIASTLNITKTFNPNTVDKAFWLQIGLPHRLAQTLINYQKKGGYFKQKSDLKKIYGMTDSIYQQLEQYVQFPKKAPKRSTTATSSPKRKPIYIDINQSTEAQWQQLKGIGPYYAKRICSFREKLGGFYQIDQVGETYRLPDSTFQKIKPYLTGSPIFRKITINSASYEVLKAHPYISWKQAKTIVNYRKHHGEYRQLEDLKKLKSLPDSLFNKVGPYLSFELE